MKRYLTPHNSYAPHKDYVLLGEMQFMNLQPGKLKRIETIVSEKNTATHYGSGGVDVFATPAMITEMENAAMSLVAPYLDDGYATVGTKVDVKHIAATPVGMKVYTEAVLIEVDGNRLVFRVESYDEIGLIGEGIHERHIINLEKFMARVNNKAKK